MVFDRIFHPFIEASPVSVMFRGTLENVLSAERLDRLFADTDKRLYLHELTFSTCVELLGLVVTQVQPSINAAYCARGGRIGVSVQSLYRKLAGIEPAVSEAHQAAEEPNRNALVTRCFHTAERYPQRETTTPTGSIFARRTNFAGIRG